MIGIKIPVDKHRAYQHFAVLQAGHNGMDHDRKEVFMIRTLTMILFLLASLMVVPQPEPAIAGTSAQDVAQKAKETLQTIKAYLLEKKHEAVAHGKTLLEKTDREIDALSAKADDASGDAKDAYREAIENLKQKRAVAAKKLDELGDASEDSWDDAKQGFSEAYKALYDAYREALVRFD